MGEVVAAAAAAGEEEEEVVEVEVEVDEAREEEAGEAEGAVRAEAIEDSQMTGQTRIRTVMEGEVGAEAVDARLLYGVSEGLRLPLLHNVE